MTATQEVVAEGAEPNYAAIVASWTPEERILKEKKFIRKIDLRLLPMLMVMYVMNYIDRNALPQAKLQGVANDVGLVGVQYNVVLSLMYIGYILMQVPSNMLLSLTRPSIYLSVVMMVWGTVSACTGAVQSFSGLAACRFFLGVAEAPFFVGVAFLCVLNTPGPVANVSGWYTRKELGLRLGIFFCAAMFSSAFGGLFAAGIAAAFVHNAIASWRWLFIIEGAATVLFAFLCMFVIPDWPTTTKWLSEEEKALGVIRLVEDAGDEESEIKTWDAVKMAASDYRVWLCITNQLCVQAVASLTNFLPTLVSQFGFNTINSLLLTAPPYILTGLFCLFNTWYSDKTSKRSPHIIYPTIVVMIGIIITLATTNVPARYFSLFLMVPGSYGCFQVSNAWMANIAARPQKKRAIALAMNNSVGNLAIVWTPYMYPDTAGPRYVAAWSVNLALCVVTLASTLALSWLLKRDNKRAEEQEATGYGLEDGTKDVKTEALSHHYEETVGGQSLNRVAARAKYQT